ncbi:MAG TPA: VOC family protein [Candidatus Acidoferrales bacterium]|nr:VOC family protein [Candidatus Acidoferrales bacterium]
MIKEIAFTAYPANDVAALRKWYQDVLSIPFDNPYVDNGVEMYNEANVAGGFFSVMSTHYLGRPAGSGAGVAFEVHDIDQAVKDLRAKGVKIEDPYTTPVCKLASLEDLEGNKVTLHQITVPH